MLASDLLSFLDEGPPPLVVSLGSFVPFAAREFYRRAAEIAVELKLRAVLLTQVDPEIDDPSIKIAPLRPTFAVVPSRDCDRPSRRRRNDRTGPPIWKAAIDRSVHGRPVRPCKTA